MLTVRAWSPSAIVRLVLCLVVCFFCGSLLVSMLYFVKVNPAQEIRFYRLTASALGCAATGMAFVYRPWNADNVVSRLGGYLVCLYGGIALGAWAQKTTHPIGSSVGQMIISALSLQGATLVLIPHFLREQHLSWKEAFGFGNNRRQAIMMGV